MTGTPMGGDRVDVPEGSDDVEAMQFEEPLGRDADDEQRAHDPDGGGAQSQGDEESADHEGQAERGGVESGPEVAAQGVADRCGDTTQGTGHSGERPHGARQAPARRQVGQDEPARQEDHGRSSQPPDIDFVGCEEVHAGGVRLKDCDGTLMTTVVMILSARVWRLLSHNGKNQPTKQMMLSTMWAIARTMASPGPMGWPDC